MRVDIQNFDKYIYIYISKSYNESIILTKLFLISSENKMLAALTKCEDSLNVDPPSSEILHSSNVNSSTIDSEEGVASKKLRSLNQNCNHRTKEPLYVSSSGTAVSCMPSFSGLPRFSFNIDQELNDDRLKIMKKNLELQTLQRRLTYLAEFYYRELLGTISWAKDLPGKKR